MSGQGFRLRKVARTRYRVGHNVFLQIAVIVVACGVGYVALDPGPDAQIPVHATPQRDVLTTGSLASSSTAYRDLLRPGFALGTTPGSFGTDRPMQAGLQRNASPEPAIVAPIPPAQEAPIQMASVQPAQPMAAAALAVI